MKNRKGFTLIEVIVAGSILAIVVVGSLAIYARGHRTAADQQQYLDVNQDVRSALSILQREIRMAGTGLTDGFAGYALEGVDNEDQGQEVRPDRIRIMGNIETPLSLTIKNSTGAGTDVTFEDGDLERYPFPDSFYVGKIVLLLPKSESSCRGRAFRRVTSVTHPSNKKNEKFNLSASITPAIRPPGGLSDICIDTDLKDGGTLLLVDVHEFWLDVSGNYPGLTAGLNGYLGAGKKGVLYLMKNGIHYPLARNVENLQFQYNGDINGDSSGRLDGQSNWTTIWTTEQIGRIRNVTIGLLGATENSFRNVKPTSTNTAKNYSRPIVANTAAASTQDGKRRSLQAVTVNIRNLSRAFYNEGQR